MYRWTFKIGKYYCIKVILYGTLMLNVELVHIYQIKIYIKHTHVK